MSSNWQFLIVTAKDAKKKRAEGTKTIRPSVVNIEYSTIELSVKSLRTLRLCGKKMEYVQMGFVLSIGTRI